MSENTQKSSDVLNEEQVAKAEETPKEEKKRKKRLFKKGC